jgi:hypothetical protein
MRVVLLMVRERNYKGAQEARMSHVGSLGSELSTLTVLYKACTQNSYRCVHERVSVIHAFASSVCKWT